MNKVFCINRVRFDSLWSANSPENFKTQIRKLKLKQFVKLSFQVKIS